MKTCTYPLARFGGVVIDGCDQAEIRRLPVSCALAAFHTHGVVLFRGFGSDVETFVAYTDELGGGFSKYQGGAFQAGGLERKSVQQIDTLLTTTGEGQTFEIPLHGEMYYAARPPGVLWFYCAVAPQQRGQTTVCSGRDLWRGLSETTRQFWRAQPIKYLRRLEGAQWRRTFQTDTVAELRQRCAESGCGLEYDPTTDTVCTEYTCSAVQEVDGEEIFINNLLAVATAESRMGAAAAGMFPMRVRLADGSTIPAPLLEEIRAVGERFTTDIVWRPGDFLMINNRTHLHGRRETDGGQRRVCVRMGEVDATAAVRPRNFLTTVV